MDRTDIRPKTRYWETSTSLITFIIFIIVIINNIINIVNLISIIIAFIVKLYNLVGIGIIHYFNRFYSAVIVVWHQAKLKM